MIAEPDVLIIGGGPAGATLGCLLAQNGIRALILERDIHPRDHVGESLTPSTGVVMERIGFLSKVEEAGFVRKPGACWTAPRNPTGRHLALRLADFPMPGAPRPYTFNVERDAFDALLLRHAHEEGAGVLQGANVRRVLFEGGRAVGVLVGFPDGWEREIRARLVVDASGRRCLLADQLGLRRRDTSFNQFAIYSWFRGVQPNPPGAEGYLFLHFLGLERAWGWQIPLRDGVASIGVVTEKADFQKSGKSSEAFFFSLVGLSRPFSHAMGGAERVRPWRIEGDYSYSIDRLAGPGWILVGDALRFVDPVFSTGVDVAMFSALLANDAILRMLRGEEEESALAAYELRVGDGVDIWYELISLFYRLQILFTRFAIKRRFREDVIRVLQGNLYVPETQVRARRLLERMRESEERISADPANLLRPWALGHPQPGPAGDGGGVTTPLESAPAPRSRP